jgi:hypothetical protein
MPPLLAFFTAVQPYLPVVVGGGVACAVLTVFAVKFRNKSNAHRRLDREIHDLWEPPESSSADRRSSVRREGQPVKVLLSNAVLGHGEHAYVVDRSTGGLKIATVRPLQAGSSVQVRALNAPDTVPWITAVVRSCRGKGQHYELGCEFEVTPPWNVLLLFG